MLKPDRAVHAPSDFMDWKAAGILNISPKFQRRTVWSAAARSYLIDTLIREMPVPPIYMRFTQSPDHDRLLREVIDGQQRISAVMDFLEGEYRLSHTLDGSWAGKTYDELPEAERDRVLHYGFSVEVFRGISDEEVLQIFERMNTHSVKLNKQELRNGKYFGYFKQLSYRLAREHLEFWRTNSIFTDRAIARMSEVELTSELLVAQMDGMQDKKKSIDEFYEEFDQQFEERRRYENEFKRTVDAMTETVEDTLANSPFSRRPLFYTLFCVVYHRLFGLPRRGEATPRTPLSKEHRRKLRAAILDLSAVLEADKEGEDIPPSYTRFVTACARQTDNIEPRSTRFEFLHSEAFE